MEKLIFRDASDSVKEVSSANPFPITDVFGGTEVSKTVAFTGAAGAGAVGTVALFTVSGEVSFKIVAYCTVDLVSAGGGTAEVGVTGNTAAVIAQTTGTDLDAGDIWYDNTPVAGVATYDATNFPVFIDVNGSDIILTVGTGDITAGTIVFKLFYNAITANSSVTAA